MPRAVQLARATEAGPFDPKQMLRLAIALRAPHMAEEEQFLRDVQTPGTPQFHGFLKAEEWNARFAPSAQDEQAVVDWAQAQGLTVTQRYPNRLIVDVEAPVETIQKALHVAIHSYQMDGQNYFSNDRDASIPAHLTTIVQAVAGLNNLETSMPAHKGARRPDNPVYVPGPVTAMGPSLRQDGDPARRPRPGTVPASVTAPARMNNNYEPADIWSSNAYNFDALYNLGHCCHPQSILEKPIPQTAIAIATYGAFDPNDIQAFASHYGFAVNPQVILVDGGPAACCDHETTLDIEWSTAMSNSFGAATDSAAIFVYEGASATNQTTIDVWNQIATESRARVLSTSWGGPELDDFGEEDIISGHQIFNEMVGEGWTLVMASGDSGAAVDCRYPGSPQLSGVQYPSSDPDVVAAGGTSLSLTLQYPLISAYNSEVAWHGDSCATNDGGSTGGFSSYSGQPGYQIPLNITYPFDIFVCFGPNLLDCNESNLPPRAVPDLALNADPAPGQNIYFSHNAVNSDGSTPNPWYGGGNGTSVVAPELAGFFAQENAYLLYLCQNAYATCPEGLGNVNYILYGTAISPDTATNYPFYDITSGCNNNDATAADGLSYYCAWIGYDEVTGWGSANMLQLAWTINRQYLIPGAGMVQPSIQFNGPPIDAWYNTDQTIPWTIGVPISGVAGYSTAWDSPVVDQTEFTPKKQTSGPNTFYDGPQFPNATNGSILLSSAGQGCHTLHVSAWANDGLSSGDQSLGLLCYDTIPPVTTPYLAPQANTAGWNNAAVSVALGATDLASGVAATYYSIDNPACSSTNLTACTAFTAPFSIPTQGRHTLVVFSKDVAGNFETAWSLPVDIDYTPPHTAISFSGSISLQVTLKARDELSGASVTYYKVDNGSYQTYTGPFTVSAATNQTIYYHSVDVAGNGESIASVNLQALGTTSLTVGSTGGSNSVALGFLPVTAVPPWTAAAQAAWLHLAAGSSSGAGAGIIQFTIDANTSASVRTGTIQVTTGAPGTGVVLTLTVTQAGTGYIAVNPLTTLISSGLNMPTGLAVDGSGNVYTADSGDSTIQEIPSGSQQLYPVVPSGLNQPTGVALDSFDNEYIADSGDSALKMYTFLTQQVTTLASTGLSNDMAVAVDRIGNVYIADTGNNSIKEWNSTTQLVTTLVSGLSGPRGVAVDVTGSLYIADTGNKAIKKWNPSTLQVTSLVSSGLGLPTGVAVDGSGNVYIADELNSLIKEWNASTQQVTTVLSQDLFYPGYVSTDKAGNIYIAETEPGIVAEAPFAFAAPAGVTETSSAGSDSLPPILPAIAPLYGAFAPSSDQGWLTIGNVFNGVIGFSFTANFSTSARVAHIAVLGQSIAVTQSGGAAQTITFGPLSNQPLSAIPFTVTASASSGLTVSFNSQTVGVCTVSGAAATVTLVTVGTCTIQATQSGGLNYAGAVPVNRSFQVTQGSQTITQLTTIAARYFDSAPFTISATASSGLPVSFNSQTPGVCTVSVATVTTAAPGSCTIQATQAGNSNWLAAPSVSETFQVLQESQTIAFGSLADQAFGVPVALSGSASSGQPVSFATLTPAVCTVFGATVTLLRLGQCSVQATQGGNTDFAAAPAVTQSFQVIAESLGSRSLLVGSAAGSASVEIGFLPVTAATPWSIETQASWLHVPIIHSTGAGAAAIPFTYDANPLATARTGTIGFTSGLTLTLTQAGTSYVGVRPLITLASAGLDQPLGVAVDTAGNVYIADAGNNAIKEWNASTQQVTTLVFSGLSYPSGVAVDGSGNVYIADYGHSLVKKWTASTQQVTTLVSTNLSNETGLAVDGSGNVYIADCSNGAIKVWTAATQQVTTLVSAGLTYPRGVAVDVSGNVYIADTNDGAIKEWNPSTLQVTTLATGLSSPSGVAVDGSGNLYIADSGNNVIKQWSPLTQQVTTLVSAGLSYPYQVAVDNAGNVYTGQAGISAVSMAAYALVGPVSVSETPAAGSDALLQTLPATTTLTGIFAPSSDQTWLTVGPVANGLVNFSFGGNSTGAARVAHLTLLGQSVTVTQNANPPALTVLQTHAGNFSQGQTGATYTITVTNTGLGASVGTVTVTDTLPSGLTLLSMSGPGWTCASNTCTRSDMLAAGASYLPITLEVSVASNAPAAVMNQVGVTGGGSPAASASALTSTLGPCDVSGDGVFNVGDVQQTVNEALGTRAPTDDVNQSGRVDITDVQIVANSAMGLGCTVFLVIRL